MISDTISLSLSYNFVEIVLNLDTSRAPYNCHYLTVQHAILLVLYYQCRLPMKLLHIQLLLLWKETVIILSSVFDGMYPPQRMHILSLFTDHNGPESPSERQRENMPSSHTLPPLLPRLITPRLRDVVFKINSMAITAGCERTMLNGYRILYTLSHSPHGGMA